MYKSAQAAEMVSRDARRRCEFPGDTLTEIELSTTVAAEAAVIGQRVETKSRRQRWLSPCGIAIGALVPNTRLRPPRLCTVSRSSQ